MLGGGSICRGAVPVVFPQLGIKMNANNFSILPQSSQKNDLHAGSPQLFPDSTGGGRKVRLQPMHAAPLPCLNCAQDTPL